MLRKNIYRWHRTSSLIIALPVLLWALSGIMHPLMTTIKPRLATQMLQPVPVDTGRLTLSLQETLQQNRIDTIHQARIIHIDTNWFYQVQRKAGSLPIYLSASTGKLLRNGDLLYAQYIARQFLEGQPPADTMAAGIKSQAVPKAMPSRPQIASQEAGPTDCCDAATACVLMDTTGSRAGVSSLLTEFDDEYKSINRLLPVYKVPFHRADAIRVYVETTQDRFAFAMDNRRALFDQLFGLFHTWQWLNFTGHFKYLLMGAITGLALLTTLMGLYIFCITKTKKGGQPVVRARRRHRVVSLVASLFTLLFTFSGGLHALDQLRTAPVIDDTVSNDIPVAALAGSMDQWQRMLPGKLLTNIAVEKINGEVYWRLSAKEPSSRQVAASYINAATHQPLNNGEEQHARWLASRFSGQPLAAIVGAERITRFEGEYGFLNKRLPVWKISYAGNNRERYYVETSSDKAAAHITDRDLFEGYSFALLHKHHFMDWAGKTARDASTIIAAALQVLMVLVGLILFIRLKKKKQKPA